MDYSSISLFNIMKSKLAYLSERQSILAENVANSETPGYKAKDLAEPDFKKMVADSGKDAAQKLSMTSTDPKHLSGTAPQMHFKVINAKTTNALSQNGNNVVIEEEMSKMAMNQADYQKVLGMYGKAITMFKTAIGSTSGGA